MRTMRARFGLLIDAAAYLRLRLDVVRLDSEQRHAWGRLLQGISAGIFILWSALAFLPMTVHADVLSNIINGIDPTQVQSDLEGLADPVITIQQQTTNWFTTAQGLAKDTFGLLLVIELFMVGFQAILYKNNVGELFASFAFKVFGIGFFLFLINDGQNQFKMIFDSFNQAGQNIAGTFTLSSYVVKSITLASMFFAVGIVGQQIDQSEAEKCSEILGSVSGLVSGDVGGFISGEEPGTLTGQIGGAVTGTVDGTMTGNLGCATATPFDHLLYDLICFGLGAMVVLSLAVILLSWALISAESAIVMTAGVFFLGFAGSRFTTNFSQGYLSYAVNVGVKAFTFWLIVAIQSAMAPHLLHDALGALAANILTSWLASFIPGGGGTAVALAGGALTLTVATLAVLEAAVMSALAFAIPSLAATFISGESSLSATHTLSSAIGALSGAAMAGGSFRSASQLRRPTERRLNHEIGRLRGQSADRIGVPKGGAPSMFAPNSIESGNSGDDAAARTNVGQHSLPGGVPGRADTAAGTATIDGTFDDNGRNENSSAPGYAGGNTGAQGYSMQPASDGSSASSDGAVPSASAPRYDNSPPERDTRTSLTQYSPREIREMALTPDGVRKFHRLAAKVAKKNMFTAEQWGAISSRQTLPNGKKGPDMEALFNNARKTPWNIPDAGRVGRTEDINAFIGNRQSAAGRTAEALKIGFNGTAEDPGSMPSTKWGGSGVNE